MLDNVTKCFSQHKCTLKHEEITKLKLLGSNISFTRVAIFLVRIRIFLIITLLIKVRFIKIPNILISKFIGELNENIDKNQACCVNLINNYHTRAIISACLKISMARKCSKISMPKTLKSYFLDIIVDTKAYQYILKVYLNHKHALNTLKLAKI